MFPQLAGEGASNPQLGANQYGEFLRIRFRALTRAQARHGNGNDPARRVRVECSLDGVEFTIQIEDEGEGFVDQDVPDPTLAENLSRPCGRGLLLMRSLMSGVEFNELGNRVTLRKTCTHR